MTKIISHNRVLPFNGIYFVGGYSLLNLFIIKKEVTMTLLKRNGRSNITPSIWDTFFNTDALNGDSQNFVNTGNSMPAVNIKETPESFFVEMAAPGMEKKDFKIQLDGSDY